MDEYRIAPVLSPGDRLDRYELLCPIAEGGMAQVWIARLRGKHGFEKLVAIKTILPKFASDPMFQKMFLDEARIASRIEHTNVAQTLDLGEQHGTLYIVMEWVDGEALTKLLGAVSQRGSKVPVGIILRILADTCGGLHAAHELRGDDGALLNVIHRDISPQNILLNARGIAKLIDFGIAKARDRMSDETNAGLVKGKIKYLAPEQALGRPVDRRADLWAIGAILYRVLAGRPAIAGENELEMLHALTSGKPPAPLPASVPPSIAALVMRTLAHESSQRFATAAELQAAMEQAMNEAHVTTTTGDVQAFIEEHLPGRAATRKETLDLAIAAGRERERMAHLLKPPQQEASSGILDVGSHVLPMGSSFPRSAPKLHGIPPAPPSSRPFVAAGQEDLTVPLMPGAATPALWIRQNEAIDATPSVRTDTIEARTALSQSRRRRLFAFAIGAGIGGLALVMIILIAATRGGSEGGEGHAVATTRLAAWSRTLVLPTIPTAAPVAAPEPPPAVAPVSVDTPVAIAANATPPSAPKPVTVTAAKPKPVAKKKPRDDDGF